jgi:ribosomal protein S27E
MSILTEAETLVNGDRREAYGDPVQMGENIGKIWEVILGVSVSPRQVQMCMIGLKLVRELNKPRRDNRVDIAGYAEILERVTEEEENPSISLRDLAGEPEENLSVSETIREALKKPNFSMGRYNVECPECKVKTLTTSGPYEKFACMGCGIMLQREQSPPETILHIGDKNIEPPVLDAIGPAPKGARINHKEMNYKYDNDRT